MNPAASWSILQKTKAAPPTKRFVRSGISLVPGESARLVKRGDLAGSAAGHLASVGHTTTPQLELPAAYLLNKTLTWLNARKRLPTKKTSSPPGYPWRSLCCLE